MNRRHHATNNRGDVTFEVRQAHSGRWVDIATARVRHNKGWQSVVYQGKRHQLFGSFVSQGDPLYIVFEAAQAEDRR